MSETELLSVTYRPESADVDHRVRFVDDEAAAGIVRIEEVETAEGWHEIGNEWVDDLTIDAPLASQ